MKAHIRYHVFQKYSGHCAYCGSTILLEKFQVDHFISKMYFYGHQSINGCRLNDISNLMPSCASCNLSKKHLDIETFRLKISSLPNLFNTYFPAFRLSVRYGLIYTYEQPVIFYFEKLNSNNNQNGVKS